MTLRGIRRLPLAFAGHALAFSIGFGALMVESLTAGETSPRCQESSASVQQEKSASPFTDKIAEAEQLYNVGKTDQAQLAYQGLLKSATEAGDKRGMAEGHFGLCTVAYRRGKYAVARAECDDALMRFTALQDVGGAARVQANFGNIIWQQGDNKAARGKYLEAIKGFESAGMLKEKATALLGLAYATEPYPERIKIDTQALEIARQIGDRRIQAQALHGIGQWIFHDGDSKGAEEKYKEAEALLDSPDDKMPLARVLLSEGRLLRAHGEMGQAIATYERALALAEETADKQGSVQIMMAMGASYGDDGKHREALAIFQRALESAKDFDNPPLIVSLQENVAEGYVNLGQYQDALAILEEADRQTPDPFPYADQFRHATMAQVYLELGKYDEGLALVTKAVDEAKARKNEQFLSEPIMTKAQIEEKLGRNEAALTDVRAALSVIEGLRAHLVPADFMKRGFADKTQDAFAYSVRLLYNLNRPGEALEVAEQARSRAFLDLLAARGFEKQAAAKPTDTVTAEAEPRSTAAGNSNAISSSEREASIVTRGGTQKATAPNKETESTANLKSPASVAPPSSQEMAAITKRLNSTVVSYWVSPDATFIWALQSDSTVKEARIEITRDRLAKLVAATMSLGEEAQPGENVQVAQATAPAKPSASRQTGKIQLRGGSELVVGSYSKTAWRELYKLLIDPVRDALPTTGGRLTIVPHGPLFRLSFAALTNERGRYLVEDYAIGYTPALGLLEYTGARKQEIIQRKPRYLVLADPKISSSLQKEVALPALPNARREAQSVSRLFPADEVAVLVAQAATTDAVKEQSAKDTVLHFATHAIVRDDEPFDSYLVLSPGKEKGDDGRLTMQQIYRLDMQADLVVLSACRTGLGKVSGDGMLGLARAFFYAGANSVMATLWDVADEPTSLLISDFYKQWKQGQDKSEALRAAQLHLLRELRAKRLTIATPAGPLALPENPIFWAGFALQGEP